MQAMGPEQATAYLPGMHTMCLEPMSGFEPLTCCLRNTVRVLHGLPLVSAVGSRYGGVWLNSPLRFSFSGRVGVMVGVTILHGHPSTRRGACEKESHRKKQQMIFLSKRVMAPL